MKPKLIVVGIDGASWNFLDKWLKEGTLSNIKKLTEKGTKTDMESTYPRSTYPAWKSLYTGNNPGKLGVYGFINFNKEKNKFEINTPKSFHTNPVWKELNKNINTTVIGVPSSKLQNIQGAMIGGPFSDENKKIVTPQKYVKILNKLKYEAYSGNLAKAFIEGDTPDQKIIEKNIRSRFEIAKILGKKEKSDLIITTIFCIDNIQHFYWGEPIVKKSWKIIDQEIGKLQEEYDSQILLVSDHGFQKLERTFYISNYLEKKGLLKLKKRKTDKILRILPKEKIAKKLIKTGIDKILFKTFSKKLLQTLWFNIPSKEEYGPKRLERMIDFKNSDCIAMGTMIYLLKKGKGKKEQIIQSLKERKEITKIYTKKELYKGKYAYKSPDIVVEPSKGTRIIETPNKKIVKKGGQKWKAKHRPKGIFASNQTTEKINRTVSIYDIYPTIMEIFKQKYKKRDGKPIKEVLN